MRKQLTLTLAAATLAFTAYASAPAQAEDLNLPPAQYGTNNHNSPQYQGRGYRDNRRDFNDRRRYRDRSYRGRRDNRRRHRYNRRHNRDRGFFFFGFN